MKVLSIDIGVNNLSYCVLDETGKIEKGYWDNMSILQDNLLLKCCGKKKDGNICGKRCKFQKTGTTDGYCAVHKCENAVEIKKRKVKSVTIQELNTKLIKKMDSMPQLSDIDIVLIEQQPSKNPTMKNLSFMLNSYFIIRGMIDKQRIQKVIFVSAKNKLKGKADKDKLKTYKDRKKMSIEVCRNTLSDKNSELVDFFNGHFKKDDLADCFLQGMYYIEQFVKK
jgi:intracellular sulfur oxidation DsrE/DsrF family protein